jgi:NADPH-dependent 7-cyano-7-deazaguanine reductase QueF
MDGLIGPDMRVLETIPSPRTMLVHLRASFCVSSPKTGVPESVETEIDYVPDGYIVTTESLRRYLDAFGIVSVSQAVATGGIYDDLRTALGTDRICVTTVYAGKDGIESACRCGDASEAVGQGPAPASDGGAG